MDKLYYCNECKRVVNSSDNCSYCRGSLMYELVEGAPVNVIGTKLKGKVLKIKDNTARLLIRDEGNNKFIREYGMDKIKKVI